MNGSRPAYLLLAAALLTALFATPTLARGFSAAGPEEDLDLARTLSGQRPLRLPRLAQDGPDIEYAPQVLHHTLALGSAITDVAGLSLTNAGTADLAWELYEVPAVTGVAGPTASVAALAADPFGYSYLDSTRPGGPRFDWIDATEGTALNLSDDGEANITLPFPFTFYGAPSTALRVGNNGGLIFGAASGDLPYANVALDAAAINNLVVPFWDDLDDETGNVYYKTLGTAPYRRFVIEWHDRPHYSYPSGVGDATLELILYETTNNLKFQYQDVVFGYADWDQGASATVGIRGDGDSYLQYSHNQPALDGGLAICFRYPGSPTCDGGRLVPWVDQAPVSGTLAPAATQPIDIGWHADVPEVDGPGVYRATLQVSSNDPASPLIDIPLFMTVTTPANWTQLAGSVSSDHPGGPLAGAHVEVISSTTSLLVCDLTTEPDGCYKCWLPSGIYTVAVSALGYLPDQQAVTATGDLVQHDVQLLLDAPQIGVSPTAISATQEGGQVTSHLLTITNGRSGVLSFELREIPGSSPGGGTQGGVQGSAIDVESGVESAGSPSQTDSLLGPNPTTHVGGPFTVDPQVEAQIEADQTADFFIWLRERADLSAAYELADREARRAYVYHALTATASRTQAGIQAYLDGRGLSYEPLWINNSIMVRGGDQAVIETMRARDDVLRIRGIYHQMRIPDPEQLAIVTPAAEAASVPVGIGRDGETAADTLWNINIVNAPQVWSQLGITGDGIVVANIDTGVRYTHEALNPSYRGNLGGGSYEHNYNWYPPTAAARNACTGAAAAPCDWNGHGSHTMGTMIGGDGDGPFDHDIGMAPDAQWMACMGCDDPPYYCSDAALTLCAQWVVAPTDLTGGNPDPSRAPDVVNNSWGGGGEDAWYYSYVEAWNAANIIPVFSAGNEGPGCSTLGSPGSYDAVLGVGGTDSLDHNYTSTSRGPGSGTGVFPVQKPDISAPGEGVTSSTAASNSSYAAYSGTSMAAPHVSGLVALLRQVDASLGREEIWDILTSTAVPGLTIKNGTWCGAGPGFPNYVFGYGRIDALAAVQEAVQRSDVPWMGEVPVAGTVPAGESLDVTVALTAPVGAPGVYEAILRIVSNDPISPAVDVPVAMTVLDAAPDLSLAKAASPSPVEAGSQLTYTLLVGNAGGLAAGLAVSDTLPADTVFAWAVHGGTLGGGQVQWNGLSLPGGADLALSFGVTVTCVPSGTEIVNADYQVQAAGMATPVAGAPLAVLAEQHDVVADFTFPQPVVRDHPVTLTNSSQHATSYWWDLGDGATSTAANPTHTYSDLGSHTVVLTASSPCQTDVHSQELVVHDYALALGPAAADGSAGPGHIVTYSLRLTNTGSLADSFSLALGSHVWPTSLSASAAGPLAPGAAVAFEVYVTVPAGALAGGSDSVAVYATSVGDPRTSPAQDASILTTMADAVYRLELVPPAAQAAGPPGTPLTHTLRLTNTGNAPDEFDLAWAGNLWDVQMPPHVALAAGVGLDLPVRVTIPAGAADGEQDVVMVTAVSRGDPAAQASATLTTTAQVPCLPLSGPDLSYSPAAPRIGQTVTFTATVAAGSLPISYAWDFGGVVVAGGPVITHSFSPAGTYAVTVVLSNACTSGVTVQRSVSVVPIHRCYLPLLLRGGP